MPVTTTISRLICCAALMSLAACGGGSNSGQPDQGAAGQVSQGPGTSCADPKPAEVRQERITTDVPQDFDPMANPAPNTSFTFSVLLPRRCPNERFPVILYGHGFGERRIMDIGDDEGLIDDSNAKPVLDRGYVEISFDQRGHGENRPQNEGGYSRLLDPQAEIRDAMAILDWAYDNAESIQVITQPDSGISRDLKVGTLGGSYGGAYQLLLAALDPRIDVIAPDRTWHNAYYGLMAGDVIKSWMRLLGFLVQLNELSSDQGVSATPAIRSLVGQIGPFTPTANLVRTREDLVTAASGPQTQPRPVTESEFESLIFSRGMDYYESLEANGLPWGFGEPEARLRPVPALFSQGQHDVLFNVTDAFWNYRYFKSAGAETRILTHQSGHMHPFEGQQKGPWACGGTDVQEAILSWFDFHLKGIRSATYDAIPEICISLMATQDQTTAPVGVELDHFPVGALSGTGSVPAFAAQLEVSVTADVDTSGVFVPVVTIQGDGKVLAGIPQVESLTVTAGEGSTQTAIAIAGIGIRRNGEVFLVDEQLTGFVAGTHVDNRGVEHDEGVLFPGVGELLMDGDEVGLLFYQHHNQYAPVAAPQNLSDIDGAGQYLPGEPDIPAALRELKPVTGVLATPNPYAVTLNGVGLPIFVPGEYAGSQLTQ